jgi:hypothetical protein
LSGGGAASDEQQPSFSVFTLQGGSVSCHGMEVWRMPNILEKPPNKVYELWASILRDQDSLLASTFLQMP